MAGGHRIERHHGDLLNGEGLEGWSEDRLRLLRGEEGVEVGEGGQLRLEVVLLVGLQPEALPAAQQGTVLEHGNGLGVEGPVGALARHVVAPRHLNETIVETQVVSQRVLPSLGVVSVVGKVVHDELVDVGERQHLVRGLHEGHGGKGDVGVGRLAVPIRFAAWARHAEIYICFTVRLNCVEINKQLNVVLVRRDGCLFSVCAGAQPARLGSRARIG